MTKRLSQLFLFGLCLSLAAFSSAQLKIAVLDTQRALVSSDEGTKALAEIQEALKKDEEEVTTLAEEIQAMQEKLQTDGEVMSPTEQRKAQKDIEDKSREYQFKVSQLQKKLEDRREDLLRNMLPKLDAVLKDLIDIERYDFIIERANLRYANSRHDITRKVTEKLNEKLNEKRSSDESP